MNLQPQKATPNTPGAGGRFYIPAQIYRNIPKEKLFVPEWHEDGILFRVVDSPLSEPVLPNWIKDGGSKDHPQ